jgi:hypothetical protein
MFHEVYEQKPELSEPILELVPMLGFLRGKVLQLDDSVESTREEHGQWFHIDRFGAGLVLVQEQQQLTSMIEEVACLDEVL